MSSSYVGTEIKLNLMAGQPTRTKANGDYTGSSIPPCGQYANISGHIPPPPWKATKSSRPSDTLHDEIVSFMHYMEPTPMEKHIRADLVARFTTLVDSFTMNASVRPVGSYVTGLYLPTSDIDMVLTFGKTGVSKYGLGSIDSYRSRSDLYTFLYKLQSSGFASKVDSVFKASVPLIRLTDKITGIQIDVTEADVQGIKATRAVQKWMKDDTELVKTLFTVLKMFLAVRNCGTTYTGGINSYVLVWMVVAWVQLEWPRIQREDAHAYGVPASRRAGSEDLSSLASALQRLSVQQTSSTSSSSSIQKAAPALPSRGKKSDFGLALKGILKFYGKDFDYYNVAIVIEPKPGYRTKGMTLTQRYLLSIFDPAGIAEDMGRKAYAIKHIQASFREAYDTIAILESRENRERYRKVGILGKVLGGDFTKFVERRKGLSLLR